MELHDSPFFGHRGVTGTIGAIRQRFYWPKMNTSVSKFILSCEHCQNNKIDRQKPQGLLHPVQTPTQPGQSYNMDFLTDLPSSIKARSKYDTLWVIVDRCSTRCYGIPCRKNDTAEHLVDLFIDHIVLEHNNGMPIELICDRDTIL